MFRTSEEEVIISLSDPPKVFLSGSLQSGLSVKRGSEISLTANISGSPYPEITWYWNNQVIQPEPLRKRPEKALRKKVEKKEEEQKEVVAEAEKKEEKEVKEGEDKKKEGEEEVKKAGEEKKEEKKAGEEKKEQKKEEEAAEPEVEELDYPTINERLAVDNRRRGTSSIVVRDSIRADHGVYTVKVENDHGTASATCEVNILGRTCRFPTDSLFAF